MLKAKIIHWLGGYLWDEIQERRGPVTTIKETLTKDESGNLEISSVELITAMPYPDAVARIASINGVVDDAE